MAGGESDQDESFLRKIIREELAKTSNKQSESTLVTPQAEMLPPIVLPPNSSAVRLAKDGPDPQMEPQGESTSDSEDVAEKPKSKNSSPWYYLGPV